MKKEITPIIESFKMLYGDISYQCYNDIENITALIYITRYKHFAGLITLITVYQEGCWWNCV